MLILMRLKKYLKIMELFKNIYFWFWIKFRMMLINISFALYSTENEILRTESLDLQEKNKRTTRKLHRNPVLEKFYAGQTDEKYVKDYYETLKKADKFMRNSTPHKIAATADNYHMNYGHEDHAGRRYEHYGFFDDKHKNAGKTMNKVLTSEYDDRRTTDDDYKLLNIFNNTPIIVGMSNILKVIDIKNINNVNINDVYKTKNLEFPLKVNHLNENNINKIEHITEFLHVKKIGFEHRQLEFFIPLKFKTVEIDEFSTMFKELCDITNVFIENTYGEMIGYGVSDFKKRIVHKNHEVWKFKAIEMKIIK